MRDDRPGRAAQCEIVARLIPAFPRASPADLAAAVTRQWDGYATSPIREFIPVLVERAVRAELAGILGAELQH